MIVYRKTSGRAHDARLVEDDYQLQDGELSLPGWEIPALDTLHDPVDPKVAHNAAIDAQIAALESSSGGYVRGLREFMLAAASVFKTQGGPDFMANKGMQNVKALDDQIKALRAQRQP